jgi:hypothetical protein
MGASAVAAVGPSLGSVNLVAMKFLRDAGLTMPRTAATPAYDKQFTQFALISHSSTQHGVGQRSPTFRAIGSLRPVARPWGHDVRGPRHAL